MCFHFFKITTALENANISEKDPPRISKAQKRRDKKAQQARDRQAEIERQDEENLTGARQVEIDKLTSILSARKLQMHDIPSDGDCMFAALSHQLSLADRDVSVKDLREAVAKVLRSNSDDFLPYLTDPKTGDMLDEAGFEKYVKEMETTKTWGGQVELKALAIFLKLPIEVIQAEGPPIVIGEEFGQKDKLILTYHRHMFGLGEHYNSTKS